MEKTYYYRKHIKILKKYIWIIALPGIALAISALIWAPKELKLFLVFIGILLVVEPLIISIFFKRFTTSKLTINDEGVHFINNKKDISFKYEDISKLSTASVSNLGGYISIVGKNGKKIRITVVIDKIGEFLIILKKKLDEKELDIYNDKKLFSFYKTACYADDSWRRIYHAFPGLLIYSILIIIVNFISTIYFSGIAPLVTSPVVIITLFVYLAIEFGYYGRKTRKSADSLTWDVMSFDIDVEKKLIKYLVLIPVVIIVVSFVIELLFAS